MPLSSYLKAVFPVLLLCMAGCSMLTGDSEPKQHEDRLLFSEAQKALDARDYIDAITKFQLFVERFPKSEQYTWALQRLGESFEGLLEVAYRRKIERGMDKAAAAKEFLAVYGKYNCWIESADGPAYNLMHYKMILEKTPDSPIADEAAYRIIVWEKEYKGQPEGVLKELAALESVLEKYPTTSLRSEILYKMAHRCRILYEIYGFSPRAGMRNPGKAEQYRSKAVYMYKLCLESPDHTDYSQKAWSELSALEAGKRIYILQ